MRLLQFILLLSWACCAQEVSFKTDVKLVTVLATVRDRDFRPIKNLAKEDFAIEEDGRPQTIRYFSQQSDLPVSIGLLVDTSRSQKGLLDLSRRASYAFLDQILDEKRDAAFVLHFDFGVGLVQGFTSSRDKLRAAIDKLHVPWMGSTLLFDAIKRASNEFMRPREGRKAFILFSDGADFRSKTSIGNAIECAQRADTIIYSLLIADRPVVLPGQRPRWVFEEGMGHKNMQRLADETGGDYFQPWTNMTITEVFDRIQDGLRNQYSFGYISDRTDAAKDYRKIRLTVNRKELVVRARDGYYPK